MRTEHSMTSIEQISLRKKEEANLWRKRWNPLKIVTSRVKLDGGMDALNRLDIDRVTVSDSSEVDGIIGSPASLK